MLEVYAGIEDVRQAHDRPIPASRELYVMGRLDAAHRLLRSRAAGVDARVASGVLDRGLVGDVIVEMVLRVLRNPAGYRSESDGDYSYSRDTAVASGRLVVTDDDLATLGFGSASTYSVASAGSTLAAAWGPDPRRCRRPW